MKTILVIFTKNKVEDSSTIATTKKYSFNTNEEIEVGDMLKSSSYSTELQVVRVLDKSFKYYNSVTGEMSDEFTSSAQSEIKTLVIRNEDTSIIYARKV